jgi:hypothetical protein
MKKLCAFILVACLWNNYSFGQPKFQKIIGGSASDEAAKVIATADGGYATIGSTQSFGAGQSDILFIKYDSLADIQWAKTYGSAGNDFGTSCAQLSNGNFILAGYTYGLSADTSYDDFLVIRISASGIVLWAKTAGGNRFDEAASLTITSDSYIVAAGSTTSTFQSTPKSAYAVKFDLSGNKQWAIAYHADSLSFFKSVTSTATGGGVLFAGACIRPNFSAHDIYVVKVDSAGTPAWSKRYGNTYEESGNCIKQLSTSEILVTGFTKSYGAGESDAFLLKLNSSGSALWFKTYGTSANDERGNSIVENLFGLYIFCGIADSISTGKNKVFMIRADSSGAMLNRKTFGDSLLSDNTANSLVLTKDSGFVIAGKTDGFNAQNNDIYLLKSDRILQTGCYQYAPAITENSYTVLGVNAGGIDTGGTSLNVTAQVITSIANISVNVLCGPVGIETNSGFSDVKIFPNPASSVLKVALSEMQNKHSTILLKTISGQTIYSLKNFMNTMLEIPLSNFSNGLYLLQIFTESRTITEKINIVN